MLEELCRQISQRLGGSYTRIIRTGLPSLDRGESRRGWMSELCRLLGVPQQGPTSAIFAESLGSKPIWCPDLRYLGIVARKRHVGLVVDNSLPTSYGCMCIRRGAHVVF